MAQCCNERLQCGDKCHVFQVALKYTQKWCFRTFVQQFHNVSIYTYAHIYIDTYNHIYVYLNTYFICRKFCQDGFNEDVRLTPFIVWCAVPLRGKPPGTSGLHTQDFILFCKLVSRIELTTHAYGKIAKWYHRFGRFSCGGCISHNKLDNNINSTWILAMWGDLTGYLNADH